MNTKFPINGRYTTLGDLIHEYGKYSNYPDTGYTTDSGAIFQNTNLWDTANYPMPFVQLIYAGDPTNNQNGLYPYNVVWFDTVYGNQVDSTTKRMKIVQEQDSSLLNFDTPVFADDIKNKDAIRTGRFKFRFIIPDIAPNNPDHYYYNYKTSDNESVVIYALRNLLEITDSSIYYFGNGSNDVFQIDTSNNFLPLFNISEVNLQKYIFEIESNEIKSVKADAYKYLGDYFWTVMYVQHENYTSKVKYHDGFTVNKSDFPTSVNTNLHQYIMKSTYSAVTNKSSEQVLKDLATAMYRSVSNNTDEKPNYKYTYDGRNSFEKTFYFLSLFLNSQRFFVSHVTSFEYVNISNMSYSLSQPILRCDLGLFRIIEYVTISKAVQTTGTILPPWPLTEKTRIDIAITYKIKYKDIQNEKDGNSIISFTLRDLWDIRTNTNTPNEEGMIKRWIRLVEPGKYAEEHKGIIGKDFVTDDSSPAFEQTEAFGSNHFLQPIDMNKDSYSDCSLGTMKWPFDRELEVANEGALNKLAGNTDSENNYSSTADTSTLDGNTWDELRDKNLSPFGYLRIYDYIDNKQTNSSFIINVPILRCNNWWYTESESTSIDTAVISSYFDTIYYDAQISEPEPKIGIYTNTYAFGNDPTNIQTILDKLNTLPIAAPSLMGSEDIKQYFGSKIGRAKKLVFASGASKIDPNSTTESTYTSDNTLYFELMNSALGAWSIKSSNEYITSRMQDSNVVAQYEVKKDYRTPTSGIYTLGRVYIDVNENGTPKNETKCFYFKVTNADHAKGSKIKVKFLKYTDNDSKSSSGENKLGFIQHDKISASFVIYNYKTKDTITGLGTSAASNTLTINTQLGDGLETTDLTIINDDYNNFVLSSIESSESYILTKHHDTNDRLRLLHLFHYGLNKNNNPVVYFKNPDKMFDYPYPSVINDDTNLSSVSFQPISLGYKFISGNNLLTSDRTLYFALNNIVAFLHVNNSTSIDTNGDVVNCPDISFTHTGIDYISTTGKQGTYNITAANPGNVLSFVTDDLILTTKDISVSVNNSQTLSEYLSDLSKNNILISLIISIYQFGDGQEVTFSNPPRRTVQVSTNTQDNYKLESLEPNKLYILKYRISQYKANTPGDTFTVTLATSGYRGTKSSNILIHCIKIPQDNGTALTIGDPTIYEPTDNINDQINAYNNTFPNDSSIYISVPSQSEAISSDSTIKYNVHTGWDVDGKPFGKSMNDGVSASEYKSILISNKSIVNGASVYLAQRTVYAIFDDTTSSV